MSGYSNSSYSVSHYSDGPEDIEAALKQRLTEVDNPDWYLDLVGRAAEKAGSLEAAMEIADHLIEKHPQPPLTDAEEAMGKLNDVQAVQEFAENGLHHNHDLRAKPMFLGKLR